MRELQGNEAVFIPMMVYAEVVGILSILIPTPLGKNSGSLNIFVADSTVFPS